MDYIEHGLVNEERYKARSWWNRFNWSKILFYAGIVLFIYDFSYCILLYFNVKALNSSPEFRLQAYKTNSRFMKLYYTLHYYLGDPTLHEEDTARWHMDGEL